MFKQLALYAVLVLNSTLTIASLPNEISLSGKVYSKASENVMGNHKSSDYLLKGEPLNNWTSMVAIHQFVAETSPLQFAQNQFGVDTKIEPINGDKNNIIQVFSTMISPDKGDTTIYQQNVWRYQQFSLGRGIMAIQYSVRKIMPNQTTVNEVSEIGSEIINEIKILPLERYQF